MTELVAYRTQVVDDAGDVQAAATVEVRSEEDLYTTGGSLATLYEDVLGATGASNPYTADSEGFAEFYLAPGRYKVIATSGAGTRTHRYVVISGTSGARNIGTDTYDVPDKDVLDTRLGTTGNLGNMAQQAASSVSVTGGTVQDALVRVKYNELRIRDSDESHELTVNMSSNLSASRTLTLSPGDADRTITLTGSTALDQNLQTTDSPTFGGLTSTGSVNGSVSTGTTNSNSGTSAKARFLATADGGSVEYAATSTGYTDITGAADAALINANAMSGGIQLSLDGVTKAKLNSSAEWIVGDGTGNEAIEILAGTANNARLRFTDSAGVAQGYVNYDTVNDRLEFGTNSTLQGRITSGGQLQLDNGGISFDSGTNVLDTFTDISNWTPAITFATPGDLSVAYSIQIGKYDIVGSTCRCWFVLSTSTFTHTTASGSLSITGLPQTIAGGTNFVARAAIMFQGINKTNYTSVIASAYQGNTTVNIEACGESQSTAAVTAADMPTTGSVLLQGYIEFPI